MLLTAVLMGAALVVAPGPADATTYPSPTPVTFTSRPGEPRFVVRCDHSHFAVADPIVYPREPGQGHNHEFFGATTTDAYSTVQTLVNSSNSCDVTDDHSAYWFPALIEGGETIPAESLRVYYITQTADPVTPFPEGFRVIAGSGSSQGTQDMVRFNCRAEGGIPPQETMPTCPGQTLRITLEFANCSDGRLDSADHKSHMAYTDGRGRCPETHPIAMPTLLAELSFVSNGGPDVEFASGGQMSFHGDFMHAWHPSTLGQLVDSCLRARLSCGLVRDA